MQNNRLILIFLLMGLLTGFPIAAGVIAGANLLGQGINALSQGKQNKKQREWSEKMYGIQRQDSLADWAMQNEYNSPQAQMQRFRDANLNPNLIYGQGSEGNAGPVRSASVQNVNPRAPQFDLGSAALSFYDTQLKEAQIDNLKTQNTVATQDAILRAAQTANLGAQTAKTQFDTQLATELKQTSLEAAKANVENTIAQTKSTLDENERRMVMQAPTLTKAVEDILNSRLNRAKTEAEIKSIHIQADNLRRDGKLKELELKLAEDGIFKDSPWYLKTIDTLLKKAGTNAPKFKNSLEENESRSRDSWEDY